MGRGNVSVHGTWDCDEVVIIGDLVGSVLVEF